LYDLEDDPLIDLARQVSDLLVLLQKFYCDESRLVRRKKQTSGAKWIDTGRLPDFHQIKVSLTYISRHRIELHKAWVQYQHFDVRHSC
jgi:hypothetical protein